MCVMFGNLENYLKVIKPTAQKKEEKKKKRKEVKIYHCERRSKYNSEMKKKNLFFIFKNIKVAKCVMMIAYKSKTMMLFKYFN